MQSYFVHRSVPWERALRQANIPFERFYLDRQDGLVFEEGYLQQVLTALNSQIEREERSSYDGIHILHLRRGRNGETPPPAQVRVSCEGGARFSSSSQRDRAMALLREFGSRFNVQEVVLIENDTRGVSMNPRTGADKLYVFLWSSPRPGANSDLAADRLWGYRISDDRNHWVYYQPSGNGEVIRDDAGTAVAELVDNNLYVLYPINDRQVWDFVPILRRILEEALLLRGTPEERAERQRQREAQRLEEMRSKPVVVEEWHAAREYREKFVAVATEFAPIFGKQIRIHNHCDNPEIRNPISDGYLHICIWTSPGRLESGGTISTTLFGAPITSAVPNQCILKPIDGEGHLLTDEDENHVGKMIGDTIYIHYPLGMTHLRLRWDNKGPDALFRRILEEVVFLKTATEEQKSARARALAARHRVQSREEYIRACNGRLDKVLESTRRALQTGPAEVRELQEQLVRKIREVNGLQRKLEQIENARTDTLKVYGQEFDKLLEIPKIREVRVRGGVIQVFTDTLYCIDPRSEKKHEIGHFRIEFMPNGAVRWYNLARMVRNMHAPHVFSSGEACLGNMSEVIPELAANYEFAALAMVCIQFVESVNVDDQAGTHIDKWPVVA